MARAKAAPKDKIDKLVDKYKKKSAPIKAREAANQAAKAKQLPAKTGGSSMVKTGNKLPVKAGEKAVATGAAKASGRIRTVLGAGTKLAARAGLVGAAGAAGYGLGSLINKKFNISGKIVDKLMEKKDKEAMKSPVRDSAKKAPVGNGAKASSAPKKEASAPIRSVKTKGGDYPVYKKDSAEAGDFRGAFAAARKAGKKEFTWQGRKYNTKTK